MRILAFVLGEEVFLGIGFRYYARRNSGLLFFRSLIGQSLSSLIYREDEPTHFVSVLGT